jgi:hypothetical protein
MITSCLVGIITSLIIAWVFTTQANSSKSFNKSLLSQENNFGDFIDNFFPLCLNFLSAITINTILITKIVLFLYSKFIEWDAHAYTLKDIPT